MSNHFPIPSPPPELVQQWYQEADSQLRPDYVYIATKAARWGADQELEACYTEVTFWGSKGMADKLRAARRPKPLSLKERIAAAITAGDERNALSLLNEALPND